MKHITKLFNMGGVKSTRTHSRLFAFVGKKFLMTLVVSGAFCMSMALLTNCKKSEPAASQMLSQKTIVQAQNGKLLVPMKKRKPLCAELNNACCYLTRDYCSTNPNQSLNFIAYGGPYAFCTTICYAKLQIKLPNGVYIYQNAIVTQLPLGRYKFTCAYTFLQLGTHEIRMQVFEYDDEDGICDIKCGSEADIVYCIPINTQIPCTTYSTE